MARTPQETFQDHLKAVGAEDLDAIVADYAEDAVLITPSGVVRGSDGVRQAFTALLGEIPDAKWTVPTQIFEGDILFIEWTAGVREGPRRGRRHLVFRDGLIQVHTVRYTLERTA